MKILGHVYVAIKALAGHEKSFLAWGSIIPEIMFYSDRNPFKFEEIHEGGDKVYEFLKKEKPTWTDLALGMMCHSYKFGADYFDDFPQLELIGYFKGKDQDFEEKIAKAENIKDLHVTQVRVHNILDLALDLYIDRHHPWVSKELQKAFEKIKVEDVSEILANCFDKDIKQVESAIQNLKDKIIIDDFKNVERLGKMWNKFTRSLKFERLDPRKQINIKDTIKIIQISSIRIRGKEEKFLQSAVDRTTKNINNFLNQNP